MTIDPTKAKLFPEELPEAISIAIANATASGTSIASYGSFSPYIMSLKKLWSSQNTDVTLRLDIDSGHAILESPLRTRSGLFPSEIDLIAQNSMDMWAVGAAAANSYFAYTMRVTKPTIFEKLKNSITLDASEQTLADSFDIKRKYLAGILGLKSSDAAQFKKIYEVNKLVTVAANSHTRVGKLINVKSGEKAVLLGIGVDSAQVAGVPGANNTYFTLNRDISDTTYIKLDCAAMPTLNYEMSCFIPALNRLEILIESITGITDLEVRYRYGIANITLMEKIRWGLESTLTADEKKTADEFDLFDSVKAGVL